MKRINWGTVRLVLILAVVIFLYSFSAKRNESRALKEADITFTENVNYITTEKVNKLLIQNFDTITSISKEKLDLSKVEKRIDQNPMVEKAEVYATVDGKLRAVIRQRRPVARIFAGVNSYYIDYNGKEMPLSETCTARVPLITGELDSINRPGLQKVLDFIYDDAFLSKNIIGMEITPNGSMRMKTRGYDFEIVFGRPINIEKKFNNYKAFLQDAVRDTLIEHYKTINLKFTQQVVCTKK